MKWRYFPFKYYDIYERIALNDVVLDYVKNTSNGVISFTGWDKDCVNVGYSQRIRDVLDVEKCLKNNIAILRRKSSGGVTFLSRHDLSWGITVPENFFEGKNLQEIYQYATSKIIDALKEIGITSWHKPINDIMTEKGKISGSAIRKDSGVIQLHGTLLFDVDKTILNDLLKPENDHQKQEKILEKDKQVTSISDLSSVSFDELKKHLEKSFLKGLDYLEQPFTKEEIFMAQEKKDFLQSDDWLFKF